MKLYLSSYRIPTPQDLAQLVGKSIKDIHIAVIPNAKDYYAERARQYKIHDFTAYVANLGMSFEVIDLREYSQENELLEILQKFDVVWAIGGNTFCLRYEMKRSGFDGAIKKYLDEDGVYGGDSAGAIVAGRSLKGVEYGDEPAFAEEKVIDGIGLVNVGIIPHADNESFKEAAKKMQEVQEKDGEVVLLTDLQALVVADGNKKMVQSS